MNNAIGFSEQFSSALDLCKKAQALTVTDAASHKAAGEAVALIRKTEGALEDAYKSHPVVIAAREIQKQKGELAALLENARKTAKATMIAWEDAQEAERKRQEAILAAEAKAQHEREALEAAQAAQAAGQTAEADAILEDAAMAVIPAVVLPKATPKVAGHSRRTVHSYQITNPKAVKPAFMAPSETAIGAIVRQLGKAAEEVVGGITVTSRTV